jgi:hypothetical protein
MLNFLSSILNIPTKSMFDLFSYYILLSHKIQEIELISFNYQTTLEFLIHILHIK